jgi:hypothetical protein
MLLVEAAYAYFKYRKWNVDRNLRNTIGLNSTFVLDLFDQY